MQLDIFRFLWYNISKSSDLNTYKEEILIIFKFTVKGDRLTSFGAEKANTGSLNYYFCGFSFDEAWRKFTCFAIFKIGESYIGPVLIADGKCSVPTEAISNEGSFEMGVYGTDSTSNQRISTNWCRIEVANGAYSSRATAPAAVSPDVWEEYMSYLANALENAVPHIGTDGNWFFWDSENKEYKNSGLPSRGIQGEQGIQGIQGKQGSQGVQGIQGEKGDDGCTPVRGTDYWTEADRAAISADLDSKIANKAEKSCTVPHTAASGYPINLTDHLANEGLLECRIFGAQNLFNINLVTGSKLELHPEENYIDAKAYSNAAMSMSVFMSMTGLKAGDTVTTSRTTEIIQGSRIGAYGRITLLSGKSEVSSIVLCEYDKQSQTVTIPTSFNADNYLGLYIYGTNESDAVLRIHNLQIIKGTKTQFGDLDAADNKYKIPVVISGGASLSHTATVSLDTPLSLNEYIDVINKKRYNGSSVSDISVSGELKTIDSDVNTVNCGTSSPPTKIELSYYQDINKVIANLTNAILLCNCNVQ